MPPQRSPLHMTLYGETELTTVSAGGTDVARHSIRWILSLRLSRTVIPCLTLSSSCCQTLN